MLPTGHVMDGAELVAFQQRAGRHLSFSLTTACPLRCRHCLVATVGVAENAAVALPAAQAEAYAAEMPALARAGVERISFTGGEPLLAGPQLARLSEAAAEAGIECCVVTACHWARTPDKAAETIARFPAVLRWHLSMDRYHAEFLPVGQVVTAAEAAVAAGRETMVRAAVPRPPSAEDEALLAELAGRLPDGVTLAVQPVSKVGRAERLDSAEPAREAGAANDGTWVPCMTTGPLVGADGAVRPCCSSLADSELDTAFERPQAEQLGLVGSYRAWAADPLLRLVRAVGFAPAIQWLREALGEAALPDPLPAHPCDQCMLLWRTPGGAAALRERLAEPALRRRIDALFAAVFDEAAPPTSPQAPSGSTPEPAAALTGRP